MPAPARPARAARPARRNRGPGPAAHRRRPRAAVGDWRAARPGRSRHGRARSREERRLARGTARPARTLRGLRAQSDRHPAGVRRRQSAKAGDVRGRSTRPRRRHRGPALRRPLRQIARPHARRDRPRPHPSLHRQHRALAAARQPHADAGGIADLPAVHAAANRACRSRRILVCLGGPSAQTLLGIKDGITRIRGRWFSFDTGNREIRAMPTFHPAFLLRSPLQKRFAWRDFLAIKKALGG